MRLHKKYTPQMAATSLHISKQRYQAIEDGRADLDAHHADKLASELGLSLNWLVAYLVHGRGKLPAEQPAR